MKMKKLLTGCVILMAIIPVPAKAGNGDNWFGSILNNIISNSGLSNGIRVGIGNPRPATPQVRYQFHPASAYIKQCLNVPHRYVDRYGNYHDYSRTECRMILRGPYAGR